MAYKQAYNVVKRSCTFDQEGTVTGPLNQEIIRRARHSSDVFG